MGSLFSHSTFSDKEENHVRMDNGEWRRRMDNGMVRFKSKREGGGRKIGEEGVLNKS